MKTKYFKFISVFVAVIIAFSCFSVSAAEKDPIETDGYSNYPIVTGSSIDYGFLNYSIPYVENLNGTILGGTSLFSPYFNDFSEYIYFEPQTIHYYSYSASAVLEQDDGRGFISGTTYNGVMSLNFDRPVYKATFKLYIVYDATFDTVTFSSFGGDNLDQWNRNNTTNYRYISIYNIQHPIRLVFSFKIGSSFLNNVGFSISLAEVVYSDESAAQIANDNANTNKIISNQDSNADKITANNNANTDKVLNAGSDTTQPDFAGTNGQLDSTTAQMDAIEGQYKIDQQSTTAELNKGSSFLSGTNMNNASIKVKSWIERFASENTVISGFLVAALCLGLCFWVIGRKAASG